MTTLEASLPEVLAPNLASPVTGSTSNGALPPPTPVPLTEARRSLVNEAGCGWRGRVPLVGVEEPVWEEKNLARGLDDLHISFTET